MNQNNFYKLLLFRCDGIGPAKYNQLIQKYSTAESAVQTLNIDKSFIDNIKNEIDLADKLNIQFLFNDDKNYPSELKAIKNHPPVISVRGNLETLKKSTIGIVGTRHSSLNGMNFVKMIAQELANNDYAIVSGMAMGIDSSAHIGALNSKITNSTIAVLAGGVDIIWPLENESLYYKILESGCVISDMPIGTKPIKQYFVKRNALIAGISKTLILGEANLSSGSMITANHSWNFGRKIYAIPGHPLDSRSAGPNRLIAEHKAELLESISTILTDNKNKLNTLNLDNSSQILKMMSSTVITENEIIQAIDMPIQKIKQELIMLEISGKIKKLDGGYVLVL